MFRRQILAGTAAAALATSFASAATFSFENITGNSATNAAAGEAQLSLSTFALANPQLFRFTLTNADGLASSVKAVFVDDAAGVLASVNGFTSTSGVSFQTGTNGALPGGATLDAAFSPDHSIGVRARNPAPHNGVNEGETLDWTYTIAAGFDLSDVEAALNAGTLRFGVHVIGWEDGGSEAFVNTPNDPGEPNLIPTPMAGMMGGVGLGILGARRRR